jgi:hypothetical protein
MRVYRVVLRDKKGLRDLTCRVWACRMGPDGPVDPAWRVDMGFGTAHGRSRMGPRCASLLDRSHCLGSPSAECHITSCFLLASRLLSLVSLHIPISSLISVELPSKIGHPLLLLACSFLFLVTGASLQLLRSDMGRGERDRGRGVMGQ